MAPTIQSVELVVSLSPTFRNAKGGAASGQRCEPEQGVPAHRRPARLHCPHRQAHLRRRLARPRREEGSPPPPTLYAAFLFLFSIFIFNSIYFACIDSLRFLVLCRWRPCRPCQALVRSGSEPSSSLASPPVALPPRSTSPIPLGVHHRAQALGPPRAHTYWRGCAPCNDRQPHQHLQGCAHARREEVPLLQGADARPRFRGLHRRSQGLCFSPPLIIIIFYFLQLFCLGWACGANEVRLVCVVCNQAAPNGSVFILHTCAHNPTGVDPTLEQWEAILDVVQAKGHLPFFDTAYQVRRAKLFIYSVYS